MGVRRLENARRDKLVRKGSGNLTLISRDPLECVSACVGQRFFFVQKFKLAVYSVSTLEMFSMFVCGKKNDTDNLRQCERAFCLGRRLKAEIDFLFFKVSWKESDLRGVF